MTDDSTHVPDESRAGEIAREPETRPETVKSDKTNGDRVRAMLRARYGDEVYSSWFHQMEFEGFDGRAVTEAQNA